MPVRQIVQYPDPRLRAVANPVTAFDAALHDIAGDLLETMRAAPGIGITAPHVGVPLRLVVIALPPAGVARTYVNPVVVWTSNETARHPEGSVSMPGAVEDVERPARVRVRYQDLDGVAHEEEADGLLGVCLQHEIDQLDGIFWIQRLSRLRRDRLLKRWGRGRQA